MQTLPSKPNPVLPRVLGLPPLRCEARGKDPYQRSGLYATSRSAKHPLYREKIDKSRAQFSQNKFRPIQISEGALGQSLPRKPLRLSRQHRLLVSSPISQCMFGTQDCLIAAIKLTDLPGIATDTDCADVTYIHLLFDQHEVITANGAPCESLHTGPEAMKSILAAVHAELFAFFPEFMAKYRPHP